MILKTNLQLINMSILILNKIKNDSLQCRNFHSSVIICADNQGNLDKDLIDRINKLKEDRDLDDVALSEADIATLNAGLEELRNKKSAFDTLSNEGSSTTKESFPNIAKRFENNKNSEEYLDKIVLYLSKISGKSEEEIRELIEEKGVVNVINYFQEKPELKALFSKIENNTEPTKETKELEAMIKERDAQIVELKDEMGNLKNNVDKLMDFQSKFDRGLESITRTLEYIMANKNNIDLAVSTISIISPIIAYRGLLSTYSKAIFTPTPSNFNTVDYQKMLNSRNLMIRNFNRVAIPSLIGYYIYIHHYHKAFTPLYNVLGGSGSSIATSINMFTKNDNKNLNNNRFRRVSVFIIAILSIIFIYFIFSLINYFSPGTYEYILNSFSMISFWIKYLLLIWFIGWWLYYILEFYLFAIYSIDSNYITIPTNLPKFILNWINRIKSNSEVSSSGKIWYTQTYVKVILFHSCLLLIYMYFFI